MQISDASLMHEVKLVDGKCSIDAATLSDALAKLNWKQTVRTDDNKGEKSISSSETYESSEAEMLRQMRTRRKPKRFRDSP